MTRIRSDGARTTAFATTEPLPSVPARTNSTPGTGRAGWWPPIRRSSIDFSTNRDAALVRLVFPKANAKNDQDPSLEEDYNRVMQLLKKLKELGEMRSEAHTRTQLANAGGFDALVAEQWGELVASYAARNGDYQVLIQTREAALVEVKACVHLFAQRALDAEHVEPERAASFQKLIEKYAQARELAGFSPERERDLVGNYYMVAIEKGQRMFAQIMLERDPDRNRLIKNAFTTLSTTPMQAACVEFNAKVPSIEDSVDILKAEETKLRRTPLHLTCAEQWEELDRYASQCYLKKKALEESASNLNKCLGELPPAARRLWMEGTLQSSSSAMHPSLPRALELSALHHAAAEELAEATSTSLEKLRTLATENPGVLAAVVGDSMREQIDRLDDVSLEQCKEALLSLQGRTGGLRRLQWEALLLRCAAFPELEAECATMLLGALESTADISNEMLAATVIASLCSRSALRLELQSRLSEHMATAKLPPNGETGKLLAALREINQSREDDEQQSASLAADACKSISSEDAGSAGGGNWSFLARALLLAALEKQGVPVDRASVIEETEVLMKGLLDFRDRGARHGTLAAACEESIRRSVDARITALDTLSESWEQHDPDIASLKQFVVEQQRRIIRRAAKERNAEFRVYASELFHNCYNLRHTSRSVLEAILGETETRQFVQDLRDLKNALCGWTWSVSRPPDRLDTIEDFLDKFPKDYS